MAAPVRYLGGATQDTMRDPSCLGRLLSGHDGGEATSDTKVTGEIGGPMGHPGLWEAGGSLEEERSLHLPADMPEGHAASVLGSRGILTSPEAVSSCNLKKCNRGENIQCRCMYSCPTRFLPDTRRHIHSGHANITVTTNFMRNDYCKAGENFIYHASNYSCPPTNCSRRDFTANSPKRLKRGSKLSGHHLGLRLPAGTINLEVGALLLVVAMVVSSCHAMPTLLPQPSPSGANTSQETLKRDWRLCCSSAGSDRVKSGSVTVLRRTATSVLVSWTRPSFHNLKYEITYKPTNAKYRVVAEVMSPQRSVVLERLLPLTQYQVYVTTVLNNTVLSTSPVVTFQTAIDDSFQGNLTGGFISTPTMLDSVVSVGSTLGDENNNVGLVRVRAEEVGIVLLVLAVWMFAIVLFFNRWGKIRMLEPYQEPYKEAPPQLLQHRPSCPMADPCALPINPLKADQMGYRRPRQNSVFVGRTRSHSLEVHPPRRVKSALNLTTLVLQESEEEGAMATTFT
ncbi:uncharacterized protein LOC121874637 [Homarus americanus]|uniref:uncharacterized protein LOC121874637 n=1 Tax=Homarus americanus TaxID=6706 RepID=UPI001C4421D6|nr:uncharacterized protein LOC121874637 [Homarus americanus]